MPSWKRIFICRFAELTWVRPTHKFPDYQSIIISYSDQELDSRKFSAVLDNIEILDFETH